MSRAILFFVLLFPALAAAQPLPGHHQGGMQPAPMGHRTAMMPVRSGQAAFAAIQEIVQMLEVDPATDWSKVNIEALRQHLIDMDNVTLHAEVKQEAVDGGMIFIVSATGSTRDSIQRMVPAHAAAMNGVDGWRFAGTVTETGATLTVWVGTPDLEKLRALGFIGVLTRGTHHQAHHLMIARGGHPPL